MLRRPFLQPLPRNQDHNQLRLLVRIAGAFGCFAHLMRAPADGYGVPARQEVSVAPNRLDYRIKSRQAIQANRGSRFGFLPRGESQREVAAFGVRGEGERVRVFGRSEEDEFHALSYSTFLRIGAKEQKIGTYSN